MANDEHARVIDLLDVATVPSVKPNEESAVDDFVVELFRVLGYVGRRRYARTREDLPIGGKTRHSMTDVCIIDRLRNHILLLVQEDRRYTHQGTFADTEAQLIAEAIAAFVYNNETRRASGLLKLQEKVSSSLPLFCMSADHFCRLWPESLWWELPRHFTKFPSPPPYQSSPRAVSRPMH